MLTTIPAATTPHLQHLAQLAEFDALITSLRNAKTSSMSLSGVFLSPKPHSPLAQEHDLAQAHLKKLLDHPDYLALLRTKTGSTTTLNLTATLKEGGVEYEAADANKKMVPLPVTDRQSLQNLAESIKKSLLNIGGQLRSDRLLRLPQLLWYYGLQPKKPQNADTLDTLIQELEELRTSYTLGLATDMDIGDLIPESDHRPLLDAVSLILDDDETSVIESLGKEALVNIAADQLRVTPAIFLDRLLSGNKAQWLAQKLLEQLNWYGAQPDEEPDSAMKKRLAAEAIRRWYSLTNDKPDDTIKRFRLEQPSNWGKSYRTLRSEFETYLIDSGHVSTTNEAILLAHLLKPQLPAEFQVRGIPEDLPYRSSIVWVNFVHGVNLANTIDRSLIPRMTFQQFVDFPINKSKDAPPELLDLIALTRIAPTLDWAITNGCISQKLDNYHTEETILLATNELKIQTDLLNEAITCLAAPTPNRLTIAKSKLTKIFGSGTFNAEHTKLVEEANEYTVNPIRHGGPVGRTQVNAYTFVDVYASGNIYNGKKWFFTDGVIVSTKWIKVDADNIVDSNAIRPAHQNKVIKLPDVKLLFKASFNIHLYLQRAAYQKLILSQLATLPLADRLALEYGDVEVLTLRDTSGKAAARETPAITLPLRARKGFFLAVNHANQKSYYELLPSAGIIRRLPDFKSELIGGEPTQAYWGSLPVTYLKWKTLPFDWDAHEKGTKPRNDKTCKAIIDPIGETFKAPKISENYTSLPCTLKSQRLNKITYFIAHNFFFVDEELYKTAAYDQTKFDKEQQAKDTILKITKLIVPFWSSIEDLASGDANKIKDGFLGIFIDVATFLLPIGKFASGSIRLASVPGKLSIRATLPSFITLTKKLFISTLNNLNPIDGIPTLLGALGAGVFRLGKFGLFKLKGLAGRTGQYDFVQGLPQVTDPGRWKPLATGDQLGSVNGVDDVVLRRANTGNTPSYHLIDPQSGMPYGPSLSSTSGEYSLGQSHYNTLEKTDSHVVVEVAENSRVREILEVDGRTTLFIDNVAYQLDGDVLRRADRIDLSDRFKALPCRVRRNPNEVCKTVVVTAAPATALPVDHFDETKGWALWFGDSIYTSAGARAPLKVDSFKSRTNLKAYMQSRKGIYGRVIIKVPEQGLDDTFEVGAVICESIDGSKQYVFTRLNAGDFYVAELGKNQSLKSALTFRQASTLPEDLMGELITVYTGSLMANNMARIHGVDAVERAIKAMDEIAVPIGGHANPPDTLKLIKVDTSPAEAVLFDNSTRMIVRNSTDGAATWSLSKAAPDNVRQTTAEVFNALFKKTVVTLDSTQAGPKALKIDGTMRELQRLISRKRRTQVKDPRNIAFAEIKTNKGVREIYVSVSGSMGDTGYLPLFEKMADRKEVTVAGTRYFNIDSGARFPMASLSVTPTGKLQAIPHTIDDIEKYTPALTSRPTSLDTEAKLIGVIRNKYPDPKELSSITIATTMAPCDSCSVIMKQFGYDGSSNALSVLWK